MKEWPWIKEKRPSTAAEFKQYRAWLHDKNKREVGEKLRSIRKRLDDCFWRKRELNQLKAKVYSEEEEKRIVEEEFRLWKEIESIEKEWVFIPYILELIDEIIRGGRKDETLPRG